MDSSIVQRDLYKNSESTIESATDIIAKLLIRVDKFCPDCKALIRESILKT